MIDLSRLSCLGEALRDAVLTYKSNVALFEADRQRETARYDYRELRTQAERVASMLHEGGLRAGARCAILMSNQSKWVVSGLGALWAGAVLVPLDYKLTPLEQLAVARPCRPQVLIVEYPAWRLLVRGDHGAIGAARRTRAGDRGARRRAAAWCRALGDSRCVRRFGSCRARRQDVACIVYSSGTSGAPKGCMLTHDNYLEQAQSLGAHVPDGGGRSLLLDSADQPRDRLHVRDGDSVLVRRRGRAPAHAARGVPGADHETLSRDAHGAGAADLARDARAHRRATRRAAGVAAPRASTRSPRPTIWPRSARRIIACRARCSSRSTTASAADCG